MKDTSFMNYNRDKKQKWSILVQTAKKTINPGKLARWKRKNW